MARLWHTLLDQVHAKIDNRLGILVVDFELWFHRLLIAAQTANLLLAQVGILLWVVCLYGRLLLEHSQLFLEGRPRLFLPLRHELEEPVRVICVDLGNLLHSHWLQKLLLLPDGVSHSTGVRLEDRRPLLLLLTKSRLRLLAKHRLLLGLSEDWHSSLPIRSSSTLVAENIARAGGVCERRLDCRGCLLLGGDRCLREDRS